VTTRHEVVQARLEQEVWPSLVRLAQVLTHDDDLALGLAQAALLSTSARLDELRSPEAAGAVARSTLIRMVVAQRLQGSSAPDRTA
jgi:hypothetical protein